MSLALRTAALALLAATASAPVWAFSFTSSSYTTSATATAEGLTDSLADSSATTPLPLQTLANAAGLQDFANASAVAEDGLLSAFTYADSTGGAASAEAQARFVGSFADSGRLRFSFDFGSTATASGGSTSGLLTVLLTSSLNGSSSTLLNQSFSATGLQSFEFTLAAGSVSTLDLQLVSNAATTGLGQSAQHFAQAGFAVAAVPEPGTWALMALGLAGLAWRARRPAGASAA